MVDRRVIIGANLMGAIAELVDRIRIGAEESTLITSSPYLSQTTSQPTTNAVARAMSHKLAMRES